MSNLDLFSSMPAQVQILKLSPALYALPGFAQTQADSILQTLSGTLQLAPLRQMYVPGGRSMSARQSNCGTLGWVSDQNGYRYSAVDPLSGHPWPALPLSWFALAQEAAVLCGYQDFKPDACLINEYGPTASMGLHQDNNEANLQAPIVSVSLGMAADFLWGGHQKQAPVSRYRLQHGDVLVWGGVDRLRFHGVSTPKGPLHPTLGERRINLTLRHAGH